MGKLFDFKDLAPTPTCYNCMCDRVHTSLWFRIKGMIRKNFGHDETYLNKVLIDEEIDDEDI